MNIIPEQNNEKQLIVEYWQLRNSVNLVGKYSYLIKRLFHVNRYKKA
jgi:hypothetical protein